MSRLVIGRVDNLLKSLLVFAAAIAVSACGTTVKVPTQALPDPLIEAIPLKVAVRYSNALETYKHQETLPAGEKYVIDIGSATESALSATFSEMFANPEFLASDAPVPANIDMLVDTGIEALQFALPSQTVTKDYAVWIKFRVKVYDGNGSLQADFPLSAYGKATRESIVTGRKSALTSASSLALRDAAVLLLTKFSEKAKLASLFGPQFAPAALPANAPGSPASEKAAKKAEPGTPSPTQGEQFL
ncbi:MAG: hypothetical protein AAAFM81_06285 [Pseudomonadota bacterium]